LHCLLDPLLNPRQMLIVALSAAWDLELPITDSRVVRKMEKLIA